MAQSRYKRTKNDKQSDVVCCVQCGRDTSNRTKVCTRCYGARGVSEQYGRPALSITSSKDPFDEVEENTYERYHGESLRDDI